MRQKDVTAMTQQRLYTVGHSNQRVEEFLSLLRQHDVNCIVDVRSMPASKYTPQFNLEPLRAFLLHNGIQYLHFGDEFGARRYDCLDDDGQVNFEKAIITPAFQRGVARLTKGLDKGFCISLMCSEADPLECHRFSLVSRFFYDNGLDVQHILHDGTLAPHETLEQQMIVNYLKSKRHKLAEIDTMFGSYTAQMQRVDAYRLKNKEIGYKPQYEEEYA